MQDWMTGFIGGLTAATTHDYMAAPDTPTHVSVVILWVMSGLALVIDVLRAARKSKR